MKYVTPFGQIEELTDEDIAEARAELGRSYRLMDTVSITVRDAILQVELFQMPETDLGSMSAISPIFWHAIHGRGNLEGVNPITLRGEIRDRRMIQIAVRKAFEQARLTQHGSSNALNAVRVGSAIVHELGWKLGIADVVLEPDRNLHYIQKNGITVAQLKAGYVLLSASIADARQELNKFKAANTWAGTSELMQQESWPMASCDLRQVENSDDKLGTDASMKIINRNADLIITCIITNEVKAPRLSMYFSTFRQRRPLPIGRLSEIFSQSQLGS